MGTLIEHYAGFPGLALTQILLIPFKKTRRCAKIKKIYVPGSAGYNWDTRNESPQAYP